MTWRLYQRIMLGLLALLFVAEFWRWLITFYPHAGIDSVLVFYIASLTVRDLRRKP
jgi:hypothetical protein